MGESEFRNMDMDSEKKSISARTEEWFADEVRRDIDASLSYMTEDVVVHAEGAPPIVGIDGTRAMYEEFFKIPYVDLEFLPRDVVVAASGDFAYDIGPFNFVFEGEDGRTEAPFKSAIVWRKLDGQWKAVVASFSSNTPPAPTAE
jgi:ketosteroid isomerase-like protein